MIRLEAAHGGDGLRALTFRTGPLVIVAIAALHEFVLAALEESGREGFVAVSAFRPEPAERSPNMFG